LLQHVAPDFRISRETIGHDLDLIRKAGIKFRLGVAGNFSVEALKNKGFKYIFIAIGAWVPGLLKLEASDKPIFNVLEFLETYNKNRDTLQMGKTVAVVGAGNSAMDAARSAQRLPGVEKVLIIYRRTRRQMPADREELELALQEGVEFKELLSPVTFIRGVLKCQRLELGAPDLSGRRSPVARAGEFVEIEADSIIAAVGEKVETGLLRQNGLELDAAGNIKFDRETLETSVAGVYIGGDACRGPATIVEGIADGTRFANQVLVRETGQILQQASCIDMDQKRQKREINSKKGVLKNAGPAEKENDRCLACNTRCDICVEVCPNRANLAIGSQVVHLDGLCNACGNCETFCPYDSAPYQDKFTLYWSLADFTDSKNAGFVKTDPLSARFAVRLGEQLAEISFDQAGHCNGDVPKDLAGLIWTIYKNHPYLFVQS
jgi:putative selenate reductase